MGRRQNFCVLPKYPRRVNISPVFFSSSKDDRVYRYIISRSWPSLRTGELGVCLGPCTFCDFVFSYEYLETINTKHHLQPFTRSFFREIINKKVDFEKNVSMISFVCSGCLRDTNISEGETARQEQGVK